VVVGEAAGAGSRSSTSRVLENYIGGRWTAAAGATELLDVTNPATGEVLARVPLSGAEDLDAAVAAAREAVPEWRAISTIARARKLFELRERLVARSEELARSVTVEMGKTLADSRAEVARMIEMVECACAIPTTMQGRVLEDVSRNIDAETVRQPVGVCAAIVPFNFPAMVPFWFLPFALACGNTFVLKPSEQVPLTQQIAFEELDALDLPPGVVNLVNGGRAVVEGILDHPGIDAVSFVGSAPVAKLVYERAAKAGKRVQALGGAKNHMVVMPDAVMEPTVEGILGSAFGAAGQRCMAGSVVVAVAEAHEELMPGLIRAAGDLRVGDGIDEHSDVGPVVSAAARDRIRTWIERGVSGGARLVLDGRQPAADDRGWFVGPTILDQVTVEMEIAQEEVFGPVLSVISAPTLDRAIEIVNASRFGNGASIFTESGASVRRFRHQVQVGMVGVNIGVAAPVAFFPFSGWKDSFLGDLHAHGPDAVEFYTRKKTVTTRWLSSGQGSGSYFVER
jgi:malonate-semialdehyde dehydrogenase (acetylating)/methylmalonate-semialdehyde dehydrogenase